MSLSKRSKKKSILFYEIIIVAIIILAIILPNIIGTTVAVAEKNPDAIGSFKELDGKSFVTNTGSVFEKIIKKYYKNSKIDYVNEMDEIGSQISEGKSFAGMLYQADAIKCTSAYDNLIVIPGDVYEDTYTIIMDKNYKYGFTKKTLSDIKNENAKIGCVQGSILVDYIKENYPKAKILYYNSLVDIVIALKSGQIDYGEAYDTPYKETLETHSDLAYVPFAATKMSDTFMIAKTARGAKIQKEFNEYLSTIRENGFFDVLDEKWHGQDESLRKLEDVKYTGENGKLKVVTVATWYPMTYYKDNELVGNYIDLTNLFCEKYGYVPEYSICDFSGELAGISTGEYDLMADIATPTEERLKAMYASDPLLVTQAFFVTKADSFGNEKISKFDKFIKNIKESFYKNFVKEDRWKLLASGFLVTIGLSILSCIFGTLLAIVICALRMSKHPFPNAFARVYIRALQGTPIVVLLMVLYYLVFAKWNFNAFVVCVIGFSIDFSAYVAEIFRSGIESVPESQFRAAKALGFSNVKAFFNVIIPQALIYIIPVYNGQFVSMVKLTSVAGYISVLDLTKMSDIIRSRTYEAFFPLISTAIIYFLLSAFLIMILKRLVIATNPDTRSKKIKGVKENVA